MPFIEAPTTFYLGRRYDPESRRLLDEVVYYDSRDLTTHAVVVGMTGSGKTGMCVSLLEEAILDNIPSVVIDPKGDITNLLLTFPELRPEDFAPWVNPSDAQRGGQTVEEYAEDIAQQWRDGLARWSIVPQRIAALKHAAQFSIYTPGSEAGLPISILDSLQAPREGWEGHEEFHREQISGLVRALLALVGKNVDPVKDREHILIANIFENAWKAGKDLTLEDIILQVQSPPFSRLGVFDVNTFFPQRDRFKLAKELNNIIAAPTFQSWISGEPLDMRRMLYTQQGRPRISIFYLAHLTDAERTFIITLILENMLAWMRQLSGTTSLRAILYFDEVFGHFPPAPRNPPTKEPLLRLFKQARAFGIGTVLATQNPADLDYKGLSNAGTWFIGKLQTENDKRRVLSGLEAAATVDTAIDLGDLGNLISGLAPRVFLVHNIHDEGGPILMHTRWAMSYLRGPLTRQQVRILMEPQRRMLGLDTDMPSVAGEMLPEPPLATQGTHTPAPSQPVAPAEPPPALPDDKPTTPPPAAPISRTAAPAVPMPPETLPDEASRSSTPPPPVLPEQRPATPPPDEAPTPTTEPSPTGSFLDRILEPAPPPSSSAPGSFLDRFKQETPPSEEPPAEPEAYQPSQPFQFFTRSESPSQPTEPEPLPQSTPSAFWLTPTPESTITPPPSEYDGSTLPPGLGYTQPSVPGTPTQRGPGLPEGYAERAPVISSSIPQFYLPTLITTQQAIRLWEKRFHYRASAFGGAQLLYQPVFLVQLGVRFFDRKSGTEAEQHYAFHVPNVEQTGFIRWGEHVAKPVPPDQLSTESFGEAAYGYLPSGLSDVKRLRALRDEAVDYVARAAVLTLFYNPTLKVYSRPDEELRDFLTRIGQLAREQRDDEIDQVTARYDKQLETLDQRLRREMRQLTSDKEVLGELRREDLYTTGEAVLSLLRGRTTYTLSRMSRTRRYKKQAQERAVSSEHNVIQIEEEIEAKQQELAGALQAVNDKWAKIAQVAEEYRVTPFKKDVVLDVYGLGWVPQWYVVLNNQPMILPAFAESPA